MTGIVKTLLKGYGFIAVDGTNETYFFHRSALINRRFEDLRWNDHVDFQLGTGKDGRPLAVEVVVFEPT
jgi:cold shock CspA family protein